MNPADIFFFLFQSFTLVLPIFCAGLILIWSLQRNYFSWLHSPIDGGVRLRGNSVFGNNKTWRGLGIYFVVTTIICILLWLVQARFTAFIHPIFSLNPFLIGFIFSMSYVLGELVNSFVKRRLGISPGHSSGGKMQRLFDNVDGILFVVITLFTVLNVSATFLVVAAGIGALLHKSTDVAMIRLGLK